MSYKILLLEKRAMTSPSEVWLGLVLCISITTDISYITLSLTYKLFIVITLMHTFHQTHTAHYFATLGLQSIVGPNWSVCASVCLCLDA